MSFREHVRTFAFAGGVAVIAAGCDDISTLGPDDTGDEAAQFFQEMSLSEFETAVDGPDYARIEMVVGGALVARRIEIATSDEVAEPERIAARVTGVGDGYLVLDVGDLRIDLDGDATFQTRHGDEISAEEFGMRIEAELAEGHEPAVRVRRPAGGATSPDVATFVATHVDILGELDGTHFSLNLSRANLIKNDAPPPDGWIVVLGLRIEIRVSDGTTTVGREGPDAHDEIEFEGTVETVNTDDGFLILSGGTRIRIVDQTRIEHGDGLLGSLEDVAEIVRAGRTVVAWGEAKVEREEPRVLVALVIAFKARPEPVPIEDFEGVIREIDLETSTIALENGVVVRLTDETHVKDHEELLGSLGAAAEAMANGFTVVAFGEGVVESREPLHVAALHIGFLIRHEFEDFEGVADAVDPQDGHVTIGDLLVIVTDETVIHDGEGKLPSLAAAAEAIAEGKTVVAFGEGAVEGDDPITIRATSIGLVVRVEDPDPAEPFEGTVASVDVEEQMVVMSDGTTLVFTEGSTIDDASTYGSLAAAAEAVRNDVSVEVVGEGVLEAEGPPRVLVVLHAKFRIASP